MGVNMNFLMNLIQLGLDVGILALCCEAVFRQKSEIKAKDFFIFPILLVLCVVPRVDFSVGANMTHLSAVKALKYYQQTILLDCCF